MGYVIGLLDDVGSAFCHCLRGSNLSCCYILCMQSSLVVFLQACLRTQMSRSRSQWRESAPCECGWLWVLRLVVGAMCVWV